MATIYRVPSSLFIDTSTEKATIQKDSIGVNNTVGLSLLNNSAGTSGNPQFSPGIELITQGYSGSASVINKFMLQEQAVSGSWAYTGRSGDGYLSINAAYNNGSYSQVATFDGYGNINLQGFSVFTGTSTNVASNTWTQVTFQNSYTDISGAPTCAYMKDATGMVWLRGGGNGGTLGAAMFTLPAGYRPANNYYMCFVANNTFFGDLIIIGTDGTVKTANGRAGSATNCYVDGIHFYAEA